MPSTRSGQGRNTAAPSKHRTSPATFASKNKKRPPVPSRKRPRHNSDATQQEGSDGETIVSSADPPPTITQPDDPLSRNRVSDDNDELPSIENYDTEDMMKKWPRSRCKERLAIGFQGRTSFNGRTEILALLRKFEHSKMMLALALRCSLRTVNKHAALVTKKDPDAYTNYRAFAKRTTVEPMPHPDDPDISQKLARYNQEIGDAWSALDSNQTAVFEHQMLLALAGVPDLAADHVESDNEDEGRGDRDVLVPEVTQLTEDEETRYRPIYDELVNHHKVVARFGAFIPGISDSKFTRRSLRCIQKYQRDLIADSYRHEFDFWLIASSSVPPLNTGTLTWCKVSTTLPIMTKWVTQKANFPTIFGAVSQGTSLIQAVSQATGSQTIKPLPRKNKSDSEKVNLGKELVQLLTATTGDTSQRLPRGSNLIKTLATRKDHPIRVVQLAGSTLTEEDLELGFVNMKAAGRRRWKHDLDANLFRFELINQGDSSEDHADAGDAQEEEVGAISGTGNNEDINIGGNSDNIDEDEGSQEEEG
ncbi:hypothetical protein DFH28DRAFT_894802 [Melampsora americana]|nr:hypothetical protein DFH28DRAFT_894802 [Melampsora americana]